MGETMKEHQSLAKDRADWLLDAVATATQDRRFLRDDPEYDEIAGEAILLNGEKAIRVALASTGVEHLQSQVTAMREALEPFAKAADVKLCGEWGDDKHFGQTDVGFYLTFGDLRQARAALKIVEKK